MEEDPGWVLQLAGLVQGHRRPPLALLLLELPPAQLQVLQPAPREAEQHQGSLRPAQPWQAGLCASAFHSRAPPCASCLPLLG